MHEHKPDIDDRLIQHQRRNNKTQSWACTLCPEHIVCRSTEELWRHTEERHRDKIPACPGELQQFRRTLESESAVKRLVNPIQATC
jgi:hypothetical protein